MIAQCEALLRALRRLHGEVRRRLDDPSYDLNWRPDATWNTPGILIKHLCYSEQRMIADRLGGRTVPSVSHDEQFSLQGTDRASLRQLLEETESLVSSVLSEVTEAEWHEPAGERNGVSWIRGDWAMLGLTHTAHHLGQLALMDRLAKAGATAQ